MIENLRVRQVVRAAIADACAGLDISKRDREPDGIDWARLEVRFAELLVTAYARNHNGQP
jgi:hypothetical protein